MLERELSISSKLFEHLQYDKGNVCHIRTVAMLLAQMYVSSFCFSRNTEDLRLTNAEVWNKTNLTYPEITNLRDIQGDYGVYVKCFGEDSTKYRSRGWAGIKGKHAYEIISEASWVNYIDYPERVLRDDTQGVLSALYLMSFGKFIAHSVARDVVACTKEIYDTPHAAKFREQAFKRYCDYFEGGGSKNV